MLAGKPDRVRFSRRRWKALAVLAVVALLLHAGLLNAVEWTWRANDTAPTPAAVAMRVRTVLPEPVAAAAPPAPVLAEVVPPPPRPPRIARAVHAREPESKPPSEEHVKPPTVPPEAAEAREVTTAAPPAEPASDTGVALAAAPAAAAAALPEGLGQGEVEVYPTHVPSTITLRYDVRRGALRGVGDLQWHADGERYNLKLEARIAGISILTQTSVGGFDGAGLAPERFTDQRVGREMRAANFQRDKGKITFSGPTTEFPLRPGAQDRLSWMVQLASIVAAAPQRREADAKLAMVVAGARGEVDAWTFRCAGIEPVELSRGPTTALKFIREPRDTYDTRVEVWLDPARSYLPIRAKWRSGPEDDGVELLFQAVTGQP